MSSRARKSHYGRVERVLRKKAPKLVENTKRLLGMRGLASSEEVATVVRELVSRVCGVAGMSRLLASCPASRTLPLPRPRSLR